MVMPAHPATWQRLEVDEAGLAHRLGQIARREQRQVPVRVAGRAQAVAAGEGAAGHPQAGIVLGVETIRPAIDHRIARRDVRNFIDDRTISHHAHECQRKTKHHDHNREYFFPVKENGHRFFDHSKKTFHWKYLEV